MTVLRMGGAVVQLPLLAKTPLSLHQAVMEKNDETNQRHKEFLKLYVMVWLCAIQIWKNNILYSFLNTSNILFWTFNTEIQYVQIYIILVLYIFNVVTWLNAAYYLLLILLLSLSSLFHITLFLFLFVCVCVCVFVQSVDLIGRVCWCVLGGLWCSVCLLSEWGVCVCACYHTMISIWIKVETPRKPGWPCLHQRKLERERRWKGVWLMEGNKTKKVQRIIELLKSVPCKDVFF